MQDNKSLEDLLHAEECISQALRLQVIEQSAVIEKLSLLINDWLDAGTTHDLNETRAAFTEALTTSTDSKQILADWMREQLGEPIGEMLSAHAKPVPEMDQWCKEILLYSPNNPYDLPKHRIPVYKLPECLK